MPSSAPFGPAFGAALAELLPDPAPVEVLFLSLLQAATINATAISAATACRRRPLFLGMQFLHWAGCGADLRPLGPLMPGNVQNESMETDLAYLRDAYVREDDA